MQALDRPSTSVRLTPEKGASATQLVQVLEAQREQDPEEPFWTGVERLGTDQSTVDVAFHEPREPRLRDVDEVEVACHLYDPDAVAAAEGYRKPK
jgi:peptide/nickel transport system ATP-binding protein